MRSKDHVAEKWPQTTGLIIPIFHHTMSRTEREQSALAPYACKPTLVGLQVV